MNNREYTSVFISDTHLGNRFSDIKLLEKYLTELKAKTDQLYLVGDIFDAWRTNNVQQFTYLFKDFNNITYITGNHDLQFSTHNPLNLVAIKAEEISIGNKNGIATHGHFFDSKINRGSTLGILLDKLLYLISSRIGWNLRDLTVFMRKRIALKLEQNVAEKASMFCKNFVIMGHTHEGGIEIIENTRIFNLGSWLNTPWAFYITRDNKYAMKKIERQNLLPESSDLHDIWR